MADWGVVNGKTLTTPQVYGTPDSALQSYYSDFDLNITLGPITGKQIGGSAAQIEYVDRPVYNDAPPAAEGVGDWGIRFFRGFMDPTTTNVAGVVIRPELFVVPLDSIAFIRHVRIRNASAGTRTVRIWMADWLVYNEVLAAGAEDERDMLEVLGEGELIEGAIDADVDGVTAWVTGVLQVT